jgi:hypothetical protein
MNFPIRKPRLDDRGGGGHVEERLSRLEATIEHIQSDVSDIRTDLRRTNDKVDAIRSDMHAGFDRVRSEMHTGFDGIRSEMHAGLDGLRGEMHAGLNGLRGEMHAEIGGLRKDIYERLDALKDSLGSAKIWALLLYIALAASLLGTLAHGFGWI